MKRFERSNGPDTALYKNYLFFYQFTCYKQVIQGSYNIPVTKFKAFSRPFQGLIIFFKAKQNWKHSIYYEMRVAQSIHLLVGALCNAIKQRER